jgi:hypothetical protein
LTAPHRFNFPYPYSPEYAMAIAIPGKRSSIVLTHAPPCDPERHGTLPMALEGNGRGLLQGNSPPFRHTKRREFMR